MDIKIEPDDELLSSNDRTGIENVNFNIEDHSSGDGFGVCVKQEVFNDYKMEEKVFVNDSQKFNQDNKASWEKYKKEFHDDLPPIKVESIDSEWESDKVAHLTQTHKLIEVKFNSIAEIASPKTVLKKTPELCNPLTFVRLVDYSDSESDTQENSEHHTENYSTVASSSRIEQEDFGSKSCIDLASNSKIGEIYNPHLSVGSGLREPKLAPKRSRKRAEKCTGQHKTVKPNPCLNKKCGNNCAVHFTEEDRINIHAFYWGMASRQRQRNWLLSSIVKQPIKRKRTHHKSRRNQSYKYYINWYNKRIQVCQQFLMKTLDIGQMTIRHTYVTYLENGSKPDRREKPKKTD